MLLQYLYEIGIYYDISLIILINFAGYLGAQSKNRALLIMYCGCITVSAMVFLLVSIACFSYANSNANGILSAFPNDGNREHVVNTIRTSNLALGGCGLIACILSFFPIAASYLLEKKLLSVEQTPLCLQQYRELLKFADVISLRLALRTYFSFYAFFIKIMG